MKYVIFSIYGHSTNENKRVFNKKFNEDFFSCAFEKTKTTIKEVLKKTLFLFSETLILK